jgi:hypothetical protein
MVKGLTTPRHCDMNQVQVRRKMVRYSLLVWWDEKNGGEVAWPMGIS